MSFEMQDVLLSSMNATQHSACFVTGNPTTCECISTDPMVVCTNMNHAFVL